ncbi:MAG TPA: MATE family efflux transporter, partial [Planctomycetota bacterium]|nr:MATE family efflux transporter [Planctomycetota bacterium]
MGTFDREDFGDATKSVRPPLSFAPLPAPRLPALLTPLRREILRLAWPAAIQNLLQTGLFVVDTKMVGLLPGPGPLAACGIVGPLIWSITVIFTVFTVGTTALVARAKGEGDEGKARSAVASALALAGMLGLPVAVAGIAAARPIVEVFAGEKVPAEVRAMAVGYLRFTIAAFPFDFLALAAMASLRGAGDTKTPMHATLGANLFNVLGNWLLIYGNAGFPRLGVPGAGLATATAGVLEAGYLLLALERGWGGRLRLPFRELRRASVATVK